MCSWCRVVDSVLRIFVILKFHGFIFEGSANSLAVDVALRQAQVAQASFRRADEAGAVDQSPTSTANNFTCSLSWRS